MKKGYYVKSIISFLLAVVPKGAALRYSFIGSMIFSLNTRGVIFTA